ncbi:hypothetical protein FOPG_17815 [Fusarium oxysporum f. sp. conglutinans race 2 54008]|uniref:Uncharacterized protein n=1 Tax=Fusarium oxysporum f. sp. conglutinans race 2 54008 TaxID=1089457 RepID=X0GQU8_FUSOX|nr:hypothetical protein FOPG_17815 [Fusarium oxysporum f. sp. conglutinans race 2 54008]
MKRAMMQRGTMTTKSRVDMQVMPHWGLRARKTTTWMMEIVNTKMTKHLSKTTLTITKCWKIRESPLSSGFRLLV